MRAECIYTCGTTPPREALRHGYTRETRVNLTQGRPYRVYGIALIDSSIEYLVIDDSVDRINSTLRPDWYNASLFRLLDPVLPYWWSFGWCARKHEEGVMAFIGYNELASTEGRHYVALVERESEALHVFAVYYGIGLLDDALVAYRNGGLDLPSLVSKVDSVVGSASALPTHRAVMDSLVSDLADIQWSMPPHDQQRAVESRFSVMYSQLRA